ncbi:hypothetical protein E4U17_007016 [Claviceps sp. LM77 group G4]|nr:hypothetical protein E4U17_007016 [Claviceps sp. LM77 group G4]KAG6069504.1 hypothetical protein E4U16_007650 [Claviceps sp. LM84 group G4]KAG6072546.1 hypothetical protein E4U33_003218 [Claviceps sp. LM78 group G4]
MVQIKSLMVAMIVAVAPVAQAGACTPGLDYCAATLVRYGAGGESLARAIKKFSDKKNLNKLMLTCNADGSVTPVRFCRNRCLNGGRGHSDYCTAF